jgi:enamine deaminase RidA (YjgF/YER057c/UK114 family)
MPAAGKRTPTARLRDLGLRLPEAPRPLGHYVAAVQTGALLVLSGMLPLRDGVPATVGRIGDSVTIDGGIAGARLAALNALALAEQTLGSLDRIRRVVRATVSMTTTPGFEAHAAVADGASDLFASLFDEGHTRVALGAYTLPLGAAILLDVIFEIRDED